MDREGYGEEKEEEGGGGGEMMKLGGDVVGGISVKFEVGNGR